MEEEIIYRIEIPTDKAVVSIENLTKANKELRAERKKVDIQSEEGQKRVKDLNKQIDENNTLIKENSSTLEKQRLNVGNYTDSLDQLVPGLGATATGFQAMTKASLAFIATPIGLIIGALALTIAALSQYFADNEKGQNSWQRIMNIGGAIVGKLTEALSALGGFIFDNLAKAFELLGNALSFLIPGFDDLTASVAGFLELDKADALSAIQAETDLLERQLIIMRAKLEAQIAEAKLRAEDKSLDLKIRQQEMERALKLQDQLSDKEVEFAKNRLDIINLQISQGNANKEELKAQAEAQAELFLVEKDRSDKKVELLTKNQELTKELLDQELIEEQERAALRRANNEFDIELGNQQIEQREEKRLAISTKYEGLVFDTRKKFAIATAKIEQERAIAAAAMAKRNEEFAVQSFLKTAALFGKSKAASTAIALVSTYLSAQKAFESQFVPVPDPSSPIRGAIAAAIAIAAGLKRVAEINKISFAAGGGTFLTKGPMMLIVGDNPGGVERVDVTPISGKGKTVTGNGMIKMAGGGSLITSPVVSQAARQSESISEQRRLFNSISQMQIVVTVEDINAKQLERQNLESRARVI